MAREIDNFFPELFTYHNVRVWDEESAQLLPHWKETHRFIEDARLGSSQCLLLQTTYNWRSPGFQWGLVPSSCSSCPRVCFLHCPLYPHSLLTAGS